MKRPAWIAYGLALAVIVVDQLVKRWVLVGLHLDEHPTVPVFGPLQFSLVWNRGVSFGFLNGQTDWARWILTGFAVVVAGALAVWVRRAHRPLTGIAIGLVMGGALGNAVDRVVYGAVVDFVDVHAIGFFPWVFNVADSAITVGVIALLAESLLTREPRAT